MHLPESHFGALLLQTAMLLGLWRVCKGLLSRWRLRCRSQTSPAWMWLEQVFYVPVTELRRCCLCVLFKKKECYQNQPAVESKLLGVACGAISTGFSGIKQKGMKNRLHPEGEKRDEGISSLLHGSTFLPFGSFTTVVVCKGLATILKIIN